MKSPPNIRHLATACLPASVIQVIVDCVARYKIRVHKIVLYVQKYMSIVSVKFP